MVGSSRGQALEPLILDGEENRILSALLPPESQKSRGGAEDQRA